LPLSRLGALVRCQGRRGAPRRTSTASRASRLPPPRSTSPLVLPQATATAAGPWRARRWCWWTGAWTTPRCRGRWVVAPARCWPRTLVRHVRPPFPKSRARAQPLVEELPSIVALLAGEDATARLRGITNLRKSTRSEGWVPVRGVWEALLPHVVPLAWPGAGAEAVQFQALWVLTNLTLADGWCEQLMALGVADAALATLQQEVAGLDVREQAVWLLGNLLGERAGVCVRVCALAAAREVVRGHSCFAAWVMDAAQAMRTHAKPSSRYRIWRRRWRRSSGPWVCRVMRMVALCGNQRGCHWCARRHGPRPTCFATCQWIACLAFVACCGLWQQACARPTWMCAWMRAGHCRMWVTWRVACHDCLRR
jgi:hypothetical protein